MHKTNTKLCAGIRHAVPTLLLGALLFTANPVLAGPPLICHSYEIGNEKSLPWGSGQNWNSPDDHYDLNRLTTDTLALLQPTTPVLVRMETLRRAAIYSQKDSRLAAELLSRLAARALNSEAKGKPNAMAWFDAGYLVESYRQLALISKRNLAEGLSGYDWVLRSIQLGGDTASMEYAVALMTDGHWPNDHYRKAVAGATEDSLLARNLMRQAPELKSFHELKAKYVVAQGNAERSR